MGISYPHFGELSARRWPSSSFLRRERPFIDGRGIYRISNRSLC